MKKKTRNIVWSLLLILLFLASPLRAAGSEQEKEPSRGTQEETTEQKTEETEETAPETTTDLGLASPSVLLMRHRPERCCMRKTPRNSEARRASPKS